MRAELKRFASGDSYDEKPLPDLDSEAIDFRPASESFASRRKIKRADLDTLRIMTKHQGARFRPSGYAARGFPDACIKAGHLDLLVMVEQLCEPVFCTPQSGAIFAGALRSVEGRCVCQVDQFHSQGLNVTPTLRMANPVPNAAGTYWPFATIRVEVSRSRR
jgi:hypothetical protein